ncbi:MAG TPA: acyl transferase, partial [Blastocatellia bacterium]|nr:acyl transferase [Blastocatellia bacterium]
MSALGRAISFYPTLILSLSAALLLWFAYQPSPVQLVVLILVVYLLPPITLRLHEIFFPLREGLSKLSEPKYSHWWGA